MIRSLYTAATGMEAQSLKMDVISNNLANTSTTGFKKVRAEFEDLIADTMRGAAMPDPRGGTMPAPLQVGLGVRTGSTIHDWSQGELAATGNKLDLAIQGSGYLRIQRIDGTLAYTRAGNLRVDATGRLVTAQGFIVEPGITIPSDAVDVTIQPDGTVQAKVAGRDAPQEIGRLDLATFPNPAGLESIGANQFVETVGSGPPLVVRPGDLGSGTLVQGYLEGANVKAVEEMIDMITTQRAYELNSKVITTADQMLQRLVQMR